MATTAGNKHSNPREDVRIVKQNNPNNPSPTDTRETKKKKSCLLLCHSWDRFIIQAKAKFDKKKHKKKNNYFNFTKASG